MTTTATAPLGAKTWESPNGVLNEFMTNVVGYRYESGKDVKEIAKEVRKLIKDAIKAGVLPKMRTSVKISRFSMGCSLDVLVREVSVPILNLPAWEAMAPDFCGSWGDHGGRYNAEGNRIKHVLELFVRSYIKSESDWHSDYHNTNFYGHVNFDSALHLS